MQGDAKLIPNSGSAGTAHAAYSDRESPTGSSFRTRTAKQLDKTIERL